MTEKEQRIFDKQAPSTKAAMLRQRERDPLDDWEYLTRPIPQEYLAVPDAKNVDELVACRALTFQETVMEERIRQTRGAKIAEMRKEGDASAVSSERKQSAIEAFMDMFSPTVIKAKFHELMRDIKYPTYDQILAEALKKDDKK